jgi:hypothetical protein
MPKQLVDGMKSRKFLLQLLLIAVGAWLAYEGKFSPELAVYLLGIGGIYSHFNVKEKK